MDLKDMLKEALEKDSASRVAALVAKLRSGKRPIRVHNLIKKDNLMKKASVGGQDLRSPMTGGTKLPTDDSKGAAKSLLSASKADVGPMPKGDQSVTLDAISPVPKPKWASAGGNMDPVKNDPLLKYLEKKAEHGHHVPPLTVIIDSEGMLPDNIAQMLLGKEVERETTVRPNEHQTLPMVIGHGVGVTESSHRKARKEEGEFMEENFPDFAGGKAVRKKYDEKDHNFDLGAVDRILDTKK